MDSLPLIESPWERIMKDLTTEYKGYYLSKRLDIFSEANETLDDLLSRIKCFPLRNNDVVIATFPKSGISSLSTKIIQFIDRLTF